MTGMMTDPQPLPQPPDDGVPVVPEPRLETGAAGTANPGPSRGGGGGTVPPKADDETAGSAPGAAGAGGMNGQGRVAVAAGSGAEARSEESVMGSFGLSGTGLAMSVGVQHDASGFRAGGGPMTFP